MLTIKKRWDGTEPSTPTEINVGMKLSADALDLIIEITAPFYDNPAPLGYAPGRCPKLWEHEVVSLFIASKTEPLKQQCPYIELILGPHGHWLIIGFPGEANWAQSTDELELEEDPVITINREAQLWQAKVLFPCCILPEPECDPENLFALTWLANAYAMHGYGLEREYLACHPISGDRPNFHQLDSFQPVVLMEVDPESIFRSMSTASSPRRSIQDSLMRDIPAHMGSQSLASIPSIPTETVSEVAERIRSMYSPGGLVGGPAVGYVSSSGAGTVASPKEDDKYSMILHEGEFVILSGEVWKRKGWSHKKRMLLLTNKPRLIYLSTSTGAYKGTIPWTMTTPVAVTKLDDAHFDVTIHDKSRSYHFADNAGVEKWVISIEEMQVAWLNYFKQQNRGP